MNPIKQHVAAYCAETGITKRQIASQLAIAPSTFYEKMDGKHSDFSLRQARELANILGCSVAELFEPLITVER